MTRGLRQRCGRSSFPIRSSNCWSRSATQGGSNIIRSAPKQPMDHTFHIFHRNNQKKPVLRSVLTTALFGSRPEIKLFQTFFRLCQACDRYRRGIQGRETKRTPNIELPTNPYVCQASALQFPIQNRPILQSFSDGGKSKISLRSNPILPVKTYYEWIKPKPPSNGRFFGR